MEDDGHSLSQPAAGSSAHQPKTNNSQTETLCASSNPIVEVGAVNSSLPTNDDEDSSTQIESRRLKNNQKRGYMAITTHYIDSSWKLQNHILRFAYVPAPHTSDRLCDVLIDCLMDWNIDAKLSTITLDNCSTNDSMIAKIKEKLRPSVLLKDGSLLHMRCCAHILNLIVKDGLDVVKDGIERIWDSVAFWIATPKRKEKFEDCVKQCRISYTRKLCLDCPTRWNSTFKMLEGERLNAYYDRFLQRKKRTKPTFVKTELDHYFEEGVLPMKSDFDILTWWKVHGVKYPTLQLIAKDVLAIPISTVASESTFSVSSHTVSPHRSRLHWSTLEALMCTRSWLWSQGHVLTLAQIRICHNPLLLVQ
ncbi:hypothetical protein VNO77_02579 [Canavalia gladiata]|uniref:HAT C-terminal dimerisation domain-containing protein n=1 Tax=Canavalia gladiata TaxID=3824 RepID=A0AAN9RBE8_CANGL